MLRWCDFDEAAMTNALIVGTSFRHSNLDAVNLSRGKIFASEFSNVGFGGAKLISTAISKSLFEECSFRNTILSSSYIENTTFCNCNLSGIILGSVTFKNCIFYGCDFSEAVDLGAAVFENCIFADGQDSDELREDILLTPGRGAGNKVVVYKTAMKDGIARYSSRYTF
jgi:uncharacterized protein YjbI with pentapeptide repeats